MILYIETHDGHRQFFKLMTPKDFEPIFDMFPRTRDIVAFAHSIEDGANRITKYLGHHKVNAWIEKTDLSKGLKEIAAAIGLGAASLMSTPLDAHMDKTPPVKQEQRPQYKPFGTQPEDAFLWTVSQIESSGGKNTAHIPVKFGAYKGQQAIGKWGFLPTTVQEMVKRHRNQGKLTPEIEQLETMSRDQLDRKFKSDPGLETELARFAARHVLRRQRGDAKRAAYAWNMGHNLFPSQISEQDMQGHDYVDKFHRYDQQNPIKQALAKPKMPKPKMNRTVASTPPIQKKEEQGTFKIRLAVWKDKREQEAREPAPRDHTYSPDPGRRIPQDPTDTVSILRRLSDRSKK